MLRKILKAGKIFLADQIRENCAILLEGTKIAAILPDDELEHYDCEIVDYGDQMILPGLIDTHIHGAVGCDTMDATPEAIEKIGHFLAKQGTTAWQPTTVTANVEDICRAAANVSKCLHQPKTARIIGVFVEGPYLTAEHRGAHALELIRELSKEEFEQIQSSGPIREILVAPEKAKAPEIVRWAVHEAKLQIGLGHSSATYQESCACFDAGADASIHTYCGMSQLHHREPNLLGAALTRDDVYAELIADGIHVSIPAMKIFLRSKPEDKAILVSDAIRATGLPDGRYMLGSLPFNVKAGIARIDNGSLAGSTTTLLQEVRRLIQEVGIEPRAAVNMASLNPATRFALHEQGSIQAGKLADLIVVDADYQIVDTWIDGVRI